MTTIGFEAIIITVESKKFQHIGVLALWLFYNGYQPFSHKILFSK